MLAAIKHRSAARSDRRYKFDLIFIRVPTLVFMVSLYYNAVFKIFYHFKQINLYQKVNNQMFCSVLGSRAYFYGLKITKICNT